MLNFKLILYFLFLSVCSIECLNIKNFENSPRYFGIAILPNFFQYTIMLYFYISIKGERNGILSPRMKRDCKDSDKRCPSWAAKGECIKNVHWMHENCKLSCNICQGNVNFFFIFS